MAVAPSDMVLDSINGKGYAVRDWLTSYPLLMVALDPYTDESAWLLDTAAAFLRHYAPADVRCAWLMATDDEGCRTFLGPLADEFLTFADPDRSAISALSFERLPGLVAIRPDLAVQQADGWDPDSWRAIASDMAEMLDWSRPLIPSPGDPTPYLGTAASG